MSDGSVSGPKVSPRVITRGGSVQAPALSSLRSAALPDSPIAGAHPEQDQGDQPNLQKDSWAYRSAAPAHNSLQWSLFNATASFIGLPGLVSPPMIGADGLRDEGAGFHADGTTRRMGEGDGSAGAFTGQRAASYVRSGLMVQHPWLYDDLLGGTRDADGRFWGMGNEHSGVRRNGYGYGRQLMGGDNMFDSALRKGLSAGMGFANSAAESSILGLMGAGGKESPYGSGKARLNFYLDLDQKGTARLQGEGDILWPLYDNPWTTIYTQFGARSMYGGGEQYGPDRWIGNVGLGQRWFPAATVDEDGALNSGNWMFGYNAFFDYDITRGHQRGGVGLEAQYDWLKVATNYYAPLSGWKDSKDFDGSFVEERAAQGWDARIKGYLPFYREVAITGAYTQWYGDHVGMFGPSKLEKDPKVWSYGVEYTPVPALTAFVNQRQTERGRADTEFGLRFTWNFGMDAESQFKPSRVAEMRTVHGARHDFVDRENKIILEYRTKNRFRIDFAGFDGRNTFSFRLRDGFDKAAAGQTVRVTAGGPVTVAEAAVRKQSFFAQALNMLDGLVSVRSAHADSGQSYTTDNEGIIRVRVDNPGKLDSLSLSAGETTTGFTRDSMGLGPKVVADIQSEKPEVDANGNTTIRIKDAAYNADVQWKVEGVAPSTGSGSISGGDKTNDKGEATATFTALAAGAVSIIATVGGETIACQVTVKDNPYTITASLTTLTQLTPQEVTFTVKKNEAAVSSGISVSVPANAALGLTASTPSTDSNGQFKLTLTPTGTASGPQQLVLTIGNKPITVDFTVNALSLTLTPATADIYAGASTTVTLAGAPPSAAGVQVEWSVASNGELSAQQNAVQNGGTATATLKAKNDATGTITVTAKVGGTSGITKTCTVTVKENVYEITASPNTLTQLASQEVTFTVKKNGTVTDGISVSIAANTNLSVTSPQSKTTASGGQFKLTLTPTGSAAATEKLTLTIEGVGHDIDFTVNTHTLQLAANPTSIFVSGTSTLTLSNAPVGQTVAWAIESGSGSLSEEQNTVQGNATATAKLTGNAAGSVMVKATLGGVAKTATVTVQDNTYIIEATPTALIQLTPTVVTFTVQKNNSTVGSGTAVSVSTHTALGVTGSTPSTDGSGQFTLTLNPTISAAASETLSFTVDSKTIGVSFTVTPLSLSLASDKDSLTKGETATLTLSTNLPDGTSVSWSVESSSTATGTLSSTTGTVSGGTATVTLTATSLAAGSIKVKATAGGQTATKDISVAQTTYTLAADPNTLVVGVGKDVTFTVKKNGSAAGAGIPVTFTADTTNFDNLPTSPQTTDSSGKFTVSGLKAKNMGNISVSATVDGQAGVTVAFTVVANTYTVSFDSSTYTSSFSGSGSSNKATQAVVITVKNAANQPVNGAVVTLSASMNDADNKAIVSGRRNQYHGLKVNNSDGGDTFPAPSLTTNTSGEVTVNLEDIVGERTLTLTAKATPSGGSEASATATVKFDKGPLAKLRLPDSSLSGPPSAQWANVRPISSAASFPAAVLCGGSGGTSWGQGDYTSQTRLPSRQELKDVANGTGNGAGVAAGWPNYDYYWTGELSSNFLAGIVHPINGYEDWTFVNSSRYVVCRR